jgi:hypothetical protein
MGEVKKEPTRWGKIRKNICRFDFGKVLGRVEQGAGTTKKSGFRASRETIPN